MLNTLVRTNKVKTRKRVGRGMGSGSGKTSGRGHKGQGARSGVSIRGRGFEGGQNPLYMRLPKRGFNSIHTRDKKETFLLNLRNFDALCKKYEIKKMDIITLKNTGLARKYHKRLKIVGNCAINSKVDVVCESTSKAALQSLENSGSNVKLSNVGS